MTTQFVVSIGFFDIALLLKKYIFQNNLEECKACHLCCAELVDNGQKIKQSMDYLRAGSARKYFWQLPFIKDVFAKYQLNWTVEITED